MVEHVKKWMSLFHVVLHSNTHSFKDKLVWEFTMPVGHIKNLKGLEPPIEGFMSCFSSSLESRKVERVFRARNGHFPTNASFGSIGTVADCFLAFWNLEKQGILVLFFIRPSTSENGQVVLGSRERPSNPNQPTRINRNAQFIADTCGIEFVAVVFRSRVIGSWFVDSTMHAVDSDNVDLFSKPSPNNLVAKQ